MSSTVSQRTGCCWHSAAAMVLLLEEPLNAKAPGVETRPHARMQATQRQDCRDAFKGMSELVMERPRHSNPWL
jgi:hypothetical protein